jgi:hypothetical protein
MVQAAVVWSEGTDLHAVPLQDGQTHKIGRGQGSIVDLGPAQKSDRYGTVSREHASIEGRDGSFFLHHLSKVNPSRVNGMRIGMDESKRLADGDVIELGTLRLTFYDRVKPLVASGVIVCPTCGRENSVSRYDCWYDGTNLANATTLSAQSQRVWCRAVFSTGEVYDLRDDEVLDIDPRGEVRKHSGTDPEPPAGFRLQLQHRRAVGVVGGAVAAARINGQAVEGSMVLHSADRIEVGDARLILLLP